MTTDPASWTWYREINCSESNANFMMIKSMIHSIYEWDKSSNYQNIKNILSTSVSFIVMLEINYFFSRIFTSVRTTAYRKQKSKYKLN